MFKRKVINKIKLLKKDSQGSPNLAWLKKDKQELRQFVLENPPIGVRKEAEQSHKIVEKVEFDKLQAQKAYPSFLGLKLKPMTIIATILIAAVLTGGGVTAVQAQDTLPGEILYPVKLATEKVQLAFSGDKDDVKLHAKFATKRAEELEELISQTEGGIEPVEIKAELIKGTAIKLKQEIELSEKGLTSLTQKGKDMTELALHVEEVTNKHLEVLQGLTAKVPEPAKEALVHAYEASSKGQVTAINAIIKAGEKGYSEDVAQDVQQRIEIRLYEAKASVQKTRGVIQSVKAVQGTPATEAGEKEIGGGGATFFEVETKIDLVNESIQKSEELLQGQSMPQALIEVKNINVILNELEATLPGGTGEGAYIIPPTLEKEKDCIQEGKTGNYFAADQCCPGLTKAAITSYDKERGVCMAQQSSAFVCIRCGNGICGLGENACNCSQDCEKEGETAPICGNGICEQGEADYKYCLPCPPSNILGCTIQCEITPGTCPKDCEEESHVSQNEQIPMTFEQAQKNALANKECVEYGLDSNFASYNSNSQTWWFNLTHKTDICDYSCVVYALEKRAEVYPMCRGLIVPDIKE